MQVEWEKSRLGEFRLACFDKFGLKALHLFISEVPNVMLGDENRFMVRIRPCDIEPVLLSWRLDDTDLVRLALWLKNVEMQGIELGSGRNTLTADDLTLFHKAGRIKRVTLNRVVDRWAYQFKVSIELNDDTYYYNQEFPTEEICSRLGRRFDKDIERLHPNDKQETIIRCLIHLKGG